MNWLDNAFRSELGLNPRHAGAFRATFASLEELRPIRDYVDEERLRHTILPLTSSKTCCVLRITKGRCDPALTDTLANEAGPTIHWLHEHGLRFQLMYERQSFDIDGEFHFWGGLVLGTIGGGKGLIEQHLTAAATTGIEVRYEGPVIGLVQDISGTITGVICQGPAGVSQINTNAVVLAAGGFESNPRLLKSPTRLWLSIHHPITLLPSPVGLPSLLTDCALIPQGEC